MKRAMIAVLVTWILILSSVAVFGNQVRGSREEKQKLEGTVHVWEAYAKGWVTITATNAGGAPVFRFENFEGFNISISDEAMMLSPHPLDLEALLTTQDGTVTEAILGPNEILDYYYGSLTIPGGYKEGEAAWWCTEARQWTSDGIPIMLGGEILPLVLQSMIQNPYYGTNYDIWDHLYLHPTLVVGKTPLWTEVPANTNQRIDIAIAVTNIAVYDRSDDYLIDPHAEGSVIEDVVPNGYVLDNSSFDPVPDDVIYNPDGTKLLRWIVDVEAADVTGHNENYPSGYHTVFLNYSFTTPQLDEGRYYLSRAWADTNDDGANDSYSAYPLIEVVYVNQPPVPNAGGPYQADEGEDVTLDASLSFDPEGDQLRFRWDLDDDGIYDTPWMGVPTYTTPCEDGPSYTDITLEVWDMQDRATARSSLMCRNVAPTIRNILIQMVSPPDVFEGEGFSVIVDFSDPGWLDTHTAIIDWNDGMTGSPTISEENERPFSTGSFTASYVYGDDFNLGFTITVTDDDGDSDVRDVEMDVLNLDPIIKNFAYSLNVYDPRTVGYWKHQHTVVEPYGDHTGLLQEYIDFISQNSQLFSNVQTEGQVYEILKYASGEEMWLRAQGQLMAVWLNVASGKLSLTTKVLIPGQPETTLGDVINWAESILMAPGNKSTYEEVKDVCDGINNGFYVPLGEASLSLLAHDPGSDDIIVSVDWGDGHADVESHYNDGVAPDPMNSPSGTYPFFAGMAMKHDYWSHGSFLVTVAVLDDDGGSVTFDLVLDVVP